MLNLQKDKQKGGERIWSIVCWFKIPCHSPKINGDEWLKKKERKPRMNKYETS